MIYAYIRVSTDKQQLSTEAQEAQIKAYCDYRGLDLGHIYADADISGSVRIAERSAGRELCQTLAEGDEVIAVRLDRCFRDAADGIETLFDWQERGVTVHLANGDTVADTDTASGFLTVAMQLIIAHYERLTIKERITAVMDHKRKNGKRITRTDRLPYGYRLEGDTVVPHADEMAAIDLAKEERSRGKNYATIARLLHARGITLRGKPLDRHTARRLATSSASASG